MHPLRPCLLLLLVAAPLAGRERIVFEVTSPYHHIQVIDHDRLRILHFDATTQSRVSLDDPLQGHFEYTEYFHMPWLWQGGIQEVLMIGLGGASTQRTYQAYYPDVNVTTVELDPKVAEVAQTYFGLTPGPRQRILVADGRQHLRRTRHHYDVILLDAYTANRYGSYIPYPLTTREFFSTARDRLTERGVLAYNVIGSVTDTRKNLVASIYRTLQTCFDQVVCFPAASSYNVVLVAARHPMSLETNAIETRLAALHAAGRLGLPRFAARARRLRSAPPAGLDRSPVLTDDFAPVNGLLRTE